MSNKRYNSSVLVAEAIQQGKVKRNSVLVMKRQAKAKGDIDYADLLAEGVKVYDQANKDLLHCSYYNKSISILSLVELIDLEDIKPELFTYYHKVRYSMLMLGEVGSITEYKGMVVTPSEIREL